MRAIALILLAAGPALLPACRSSGADQAAADTAAPQPSAQPPAPQGAVLPAMPVIPAKAPPAVAAAATTPRAERFAALEKEHSEAMNAYFDLFRNAKSDAEMEEIAKTAKAPETKGFAQRARALLEEDATDLTAFQAAKWMLMNRIGPQAGAEDEPTEDALTGVLAILEQHHLERAELGDIAQTLGYEDAPAAQALLEKMSTKSPHREVRGKALGSLAQARKSQAENVAQMQQLGAAKAREEYGRWMGVGRVDELLAKDPAALEAETVALYERLKAEYGDIKTMPGTPYESTLGAQADSTLFEIRNLAIGKTAPEIEGQDVDGVAFKLSDYRGKVVMLDFWGFW